MSGDSPAVPMPPSPMIKPVSASTAFVISAFAAGDVACDEGRALRIRFRQRSRHCCAAAASFGFEARASAMVFSSVAM